MLKIALIDHHLNNYHADTFAALLNGSLSAENAQFVAAWESSPCGDDWCARNGVRRAASIAEAVGLADAVMVLAPDNIEAHLEFAKVVLPFGQPTFFDKLLATNTADAAAIVELAQLYKTPVFSSSALRYASELEAVLPQIPSGEVSDLLVRGINDWDLYGVHTVAMALRIMGPGIKRLIDTGRQGARTVTLDYGDGKRAVLDVRHASNEGEFFSWSFAARVGEAYVGSGITDSAGFYANLLRRALAFLKSGESEMPLNEAFAAVAVIEAANRSLELGGNWVEPVISDG